MNERLFRQMRRNRIKDALFSSRQIDVRDIALIEAESRARVQEHRAAYEQHLARYPVVLGGEHGFPLPGSRSGPSDLG